MKRCFFLIVMMVGGVSFANAQETQSAEKAVSDSVPRKAKKMRSPMERLYSNGETMAETERAIPATVDAVSVEEKEGDVKLLGEKMKKLAEKSKMASSSNPKETVEEKKAVPQVATEKTVLKSATKQLSKKRTIKKGKKKSSGKRKSVVTHK